MKHLRFKTIDKKRINNKTREIGKKREVDMILKIPNKKEGWSFFECETFHYQYIRLCDIKEECFRFLDYEPKELKNEKKMVKIIRIEPQNKRRPIISDRMCYILNDGGKTIDRL